MFLFTFCCGAIYYTSTNLTNHIIKNALLSKTKHYPNKVKKYNLYGGMAQASSIFKIVIHLIKILNFNQLYNDFENKRRE